MSGFVVMPYPYAFMHQTESVPRKNVSGFAKNVVQYAVVARLLGIYIEGFSPHFLFRFTDVNFPSGKESALITNIIWPTLTLTTPKNLKILQKSEKVFVL